MKKTVLFFDCFLCLFYPFFQKKATLFVSKNIPYLKLFSEKNRFAIRQLTEAYATCFSLPSGSRHIRPFFCIDDDAIARFHEERSRNLDAVSERTSLAAARSRIPLEAGGRVKVVPLETSIQI